METKRERKRTRAEGGLFGDKQRLKVKYTSNSVDNIGNEGGVEHFLGGDGLDELCADALAVIERVHGVEVDYHRRQLQLHRPS